VDGRVYPLAIGGRVRCRLSQWSADVAKERDKNSEPHHHHQQQGKKGDVPPERRAGEQDRQGKGGSDDLHQKAARVMVVDDEPDIAAVFKEGLEMSGFEVAAYTDPQKALAEYKPGEYDLILLDIRMPVMTGYQLYRELKKKGRGGQNGGPKVVFVTAFYDAQDEVKEMFPELAQGCVIEKPIEIRGLVRAIKKRIAAASATMDTC
jgi:CheY-like chemotaxis protein